MKTTGLICSLALIASLLGGFGILKCHTVDYKDWPDADQEVEMDAFQFYFRSSFVAMQNSKGKWYFGCILTGTRVILCHTTGSNLPPDQQNITIYTNKNKIFDDPAGIPFDAKIVRRFTIDSQNILGPGYKNQKLEKFVLDRDADTKNVRVVRFSPVTQAEKWSGGVVVSGPTEHCGIRSLPRGITHPRGETGTRQFYENIVEDYCTHSMIGNFVFINPMNYNEPPSLLGMVYDQSIEYENTLSFHSVTPFLLNSWAE